MPDHSTFTTNQTIDHQHSKLDVPLRTLSSTAMSQHQSIPGSVKPSGGYDYSENRSSSIRVVHPSASLLTLDDYNLISLGYKPVMSRSLSWVSVTGISITASNVLCGIVALYGLPLTNGGPAWVTWSYLIVGIMSCIVSLCLAELAAAYPTAAGVHHWVYQLAHSKQKPFLTWMTGWLAFVGAIASASSIAFYFSSVLGQILFSLYRIALTPGILVMFHLGAVLIWQLFNLFPVRGLGYISTFGGIYIIGVTVTTIIVILSYSSVDSSMAHVPFTVFLNYSGSSSAFYATMSSALMASFVFCPQDSIIRMSEEARRPDYIIPKLVIGSNVVGLVLGFPLIVALNYGILQPMKGLLDEAVPAVRVILVTLGKSVGTLFVSLIISGIFFTGLARLSIATRVAYALSRDEGFPKSSYWNHLQPQRKTPQRISWLITVACMSGIFPFYWGDNNAFHWIASLACISTNLSFVIPLWIRLTKEGKLKHNTGPLTLSASSQFLYTISILWLFFLSIILMLPTTFPITRGNFNYASLAIFVITVIAALSWFKAKYSFNGSAKEESRAPSRSQLSFSRRPSHATISSFYTHNSQHSSNHPNEQGYVTPHKAEIQYTELPPLPPQSLVRKKSISGGSMMFGSETINERGARPSYTGTFQTRTITEDQRISQDQNPLWRGVSSTDTRGRTHSYDHRSHISGRRSSRGLISAKTISVTSNTYQDQPVSILGVPLTSSPEVAHLELSGVLSSTALSSHKQNEPPSSTNYHDDGFSLSSSPVLKASKLGMSGSYNSVPEISIAPPTTISSNDSRASLGIQSQSQTTMSEVHFSPQVQHEESTDTHPISCPPERKRSSRSGTLSSLVMRPPNATESIFPELSPTSPSSCSGSRHFIELNSADNRGRDDLFDDIYYTNDIEESMNGTKISTVYRSVRSHSTKRRAKTSSQTATSTFDTLAISKNNLGTLDKDTTVIESAVRVKDLHGDDSFDEEYLHQYPVISAYQSTQGLFNVIPSPSSIAAQELIAVLQRTNSSRSVDVGNEEKRQRSVDFGLIPQKDVVSEKADHKNTCEKKFNDKNHVVAQWALEQAKIQKRRLEKMRVKELNERRQNNNPLGDVANSHGETMKTIQNSGSHDNT